MGDYAETITLSDVTVGNGWIGINNITPTVNEATPSDDLVRVRMTFALGQTRYVLDSEAGEDGTITITDASGWSASIAARDDFLPRAGKWAFEIDFYRSGQDSPWTLYRGVLTAHDNLD